MDDQRPSRRSLQPWDDVGPGASPAGPQIEVAIETAAPRGERWEAGYIEGISEQWFGFLEKSQQGKETGTFQQG